MNSQTQTRDEKPNQTDEVDDESDQPTHWLETDPLGYFDKLRDMLTSV